MPEPSQEMSIAQLGHRPGMHVSVNLQGKTVGGVSITSEQWVDGVIVGISAHGTFVTVKLDVPVGGSERKGLLRSASRGQDLVSIDDAARVRARALRDVAPGGIPADIVELARAGRTLEAIKRYRALNGSTLDEARLAIAEI